MSEISGCGNNVEEQPFRVHELCVVLVVRGEIMSRVRRLSGAAKGHPE